MLLKSPELAKSGDGTIVDMDFSTCVIEGIAVSDGLYELRGLTVSAAQTDTIAALTGVKIK